MGNKKSFAKRLKTMLSVDLQRMFSTPMLYIMVAIAFALPVVMMTMLNGFGDVQAISNVWQMVGSASGASADMTSMTGMLNVNMMYIAAAALVCTFVADDFRSGYAKHLFATRAKKGDYVASKTIVGFIGGALMVAAFVAGTLIAGAMLQLPFTLGQGVGVGNVVMCLLAKVFLMAVFCAIYVLASVLFKQRLWASVLGSVGAGMLLFMTVGIVTPLDATFMHFFLALAGGAIFAIGIGCASAALLNRLDIAK